MNTQELIKIHEKCINILEAVDIYEGRIKDTNYSLAFGFACREFPGIKAKYENNIIIYKMCKARLMERYNKLKTK